MFQVYLLTCVYIERERKGIYIWNQTLSIVFIPLPINIKDSLKFQPPKKKKGEKVCIKNNIKKKTRKEKREAPKYLYIMGYHGEICIIDREPKN
jgi:hypothetical protein